MPAHDISRDFFYLRWAFEINLLSLLCWLLYNSNSSKPNRSASPFGRKNRKIFSYLWAFVKTTYSTIAIAKPRTRQSPYWNLLSVGKDELTGAAPRAPTDDSGTLSHTPTISRIAAPTLLLLLAPVKLVAKYSNADLQRATKLALEMFI